MGYTHYWRQYDGFNSDKWDALVQHSLYLQAAVYPSAKLADVEMSDFQISFNGVAPQNHETFTLDRAMSPPNNRDHFFNFCKTAQKPYLEYGSDDPTNDAVTTRVLTIMEASEY
jgi:hypothetical protein